MRIFIFILFALAFGKVGTQAYIRQDSAKATIIDAYREHALAACSPYVTAGAAARQPKGPANPLGNEAEPPGAAHHLSVDLMIGNEHLDVRLWQTSDARWSARYRDPFLLVRSSAHATVCEYDIKRGSVYARAPAPRPENG